MQDRRVGLSAKRRTVLGKKVGALRRTGWTPANVFGPGEPSVSIQIPTREIERLLSHVPRTALISLGIDEQEGVTVLVRGVDRKPTTDELYHVDFYRVSMTHTLKATVPIVQVGEAPAADLLDATIVREIDAIEVECLPDDLPLQIEVNIEGLTEIDAAIRVRDLVLPPRVTVLADPDAIIVHAMAPKLMAEEEQEAAAEEAEAAEGAEGEAEPAAETKTEAEAEKRD